MIDLRNTWCEATEENYMKLINLGFIIAPKSINGYVCMIPNHIREGQVWLYSDYNYIPSINKQIHLVDGEFQYVTDTDDREAKDKASINILRNLHHDLGTLKWEGSDEGWNFAVEKVRETLAEKIEELAKTKWYEIKANFPCVVKYKSYNGKYLYQIAYSYCDQFNHILDDVDKRINDVNKIELATDEEIDQLKVKK